jgi:hypothetical protein
MGYRAALITLLLVSTSLVVASTTQPTTRPTAYCGLTLRDEDGSPRTLVKLIAPGPLEGRGFSSPHLTRGDTVLAVNGRPMRAAEFDQLIAASSVGDEIVLRVKRTGSDRLTAIPEATADGKEEELKFRLADASEWRGPMHMPRPERPSSRLEVSESPSRCESFIVKQIDQQQLGEPVEKLSQLLATTQRKFAGFNGLSRVAWAFDHPLRLASLQRAITGPLPAIASDPRLVLNEAADNLDVPHPSQLSEPPDLRDAQATVDWLARQMELADADLTRAFVAIDPQSRQDLPAALIEMLAWVAKPKSVDASPQPQRFIRAMQASTKIDYAAVFDAAGRVAGVMRASSTPAPTTSPSTQPAVALPPELAGAVSGEILAVTHCAAGWIVYGSAGANHYDLSRIAAVVDAGGDDVYSYETNSRPRVQVVVDLAGNDVYRSDSGALLPGPAGAVMGVNIVVDVNGDDTYHGSIVSGGAGVCGIGILVDAAGNDRYEGTSWCQGAGVYGAGALIDLGGGDVYTAQDLSQAIGGPRGFGMILDTIGDDLYRANGPVPSAYDTPAVFYSMSQGVGFGIRGYDTGGIGVLEDLGGNDRYEGGEFAQGGGYFMGLGILHDRDGNDAYFGNRYSQGFAAHEGLGICADDAGNDMYYGMTAANQGAAWDISAALCIDRAGNDTYRGDGLSQGSAAMQAIGMLIDLGGDDHYTAPAPASQGAGASNIYNYGTTGCFSFSLLLDAAAGRDTYSTQRQDGQTVKTGSINEKSPETSDAWGMFIDTEEKMGD